MNFERAKLLIERLRNASPEEQWRIIKSMTPLDLAALDAWFELWAHSNQLPPGSDGWRVWLLMAGRGFGKTRAGSEWVHGLAMARPGCRIALVGATIHDARSIMVEGVSGLLTVAKNHGQRLAWEPSLGRLRWPNGSEAQTFSGDNADGLRGPEHDFVWESPDARHACRRSDRGAAERNPAYGAGRGSLLHRRRGSHRRMVGTVAIHRCMDERGMALHYAAGGRVALRTHQRHIRDIPQRLLGVGKRPGYVDRHRR